MDEELQQWLKQHGLDIVPVLDGEIHRFSCGTKSKKLWYIGSVIIQGTRRITTLSYGDWSVSGSKPIATFRSGGAEFKKEELDKYYETVEKRKKEAQEKRLKEQEAAAKEAEKVWGSGLEIQEWRSDYLLKKGITETSKGIKRSHDEILLIPMRDIHGKLWGIQRIWPDGTKRFLTGQRTAGTLFRFETGVNGTVLACEGFATGASLALLGFTTYVGFNASNLTSVATAIRRLHPDVQIIICGDDDRWGKDPRKNIGKQKATEAALAVGGIAVFPEFDPLFNTDDGHGSFKIERPTDFNDLYCLEGIDEVRRQITKAASGEGSAGVNGCDGRDGGLLGETKGLLESDTKRPELETAKESVSSSVQSEEKIKNEFPIHALGPLLSHVVALVCEKTSTPIEMVASSVLAGVSVCLQEFYNVKAFGSIRPISLYFVTIAGSGERKSTVDSLILRPHYKWRDEKFREYEEKKKKYKLAIEEYKEAQFKKNDYKPSKPTPPKAPVLFATEPTIEGLFFCLKFHRNSIGLFADEGGTWLGGHSMKSENIRGTLAKLNSLWDGKPIDRIRRGSDEGEVDMLFDKRVSSHLMIQPKLANELFGNEYARSQGYLARCLVCKPKSMMGKRKFVWEVNLDEEFRKYGEMIHALLNNVSEGPVTLVPSEGAISSIKAFHDEIEPLQDHGGEYSFIGDFTSKLPEHCIRLAAMLEAFYNPYATSISKEWMDRGIEIGRFYLSSHCVTTKEAKRPSDPTQNDRDVLISFVLRKDTWRLRDLMRVGPKKFRKKEVIIPALKELEDDGYIKFCEREGTITSGHISN